MRTKAILVIFFAITGLSMQVIAQRKKKDVTTPVTIRFEHIAKNNVPLDSVLIIFDRYDLTGAGVVKKIFYPVGNVISIDEVPEGKYYIEALCLGMIKYYFKHEGFIYKGKNKIAFKLPATEKFFPGTFLAEDYFNVNKLAITTYRVKN